MNSQLSLGYRCDQLKSNKTSIKTKHRDYGCNIFRKSRRRGSDVCYKRLDFPMAILVYFFSSRSIGLVSKQRHCHICQTICSTRFDVRACLLVVWCKNFQPPLYSLPKYKIFRCKMRFFVKLAHLL